MWIAGRVERRHVRFAGRSIQHPPAFKSAACIRRITADMLMSDSIPPRGAKKTKLLEFMRGSDFNNSTASFGRGTLCSRSIFMRSTGTIHTPLVRSTSSHFILRTSPERAAVSVRNWSARAAIPSRSFRADHQRRASERLRAGWCCSFLILFGAGSNSERLPFHRAGFSPSRCPATVAHYSTASMRPLTRWAVSVFSVQIGSSTRKMFCIVI